MTTPPEERSRRPALPRPDLAAAAALLALMVLLFRPLVFGGQGLFERDVHLMVYGQLATFARSFSLGSLPVWDPYLGFGQPFLANPGTQVLYPPTWLVLLMSPVPAYSVYVVGHLTFGGLGFYLLARRLGLSRLASWGGGGVFVLSGPLLSLVSLWQHLAGACWMPWVVLAAHVALARAAWGSSLLWGVVGAGQVLSGSVDMTALTWAFVLLDGVRFAERPWASPTNGRRLVAAAAAVGVTLLLTVALWLPAIDLLRQSSRADLSEGVRSYWSLHPLVLGQLLLPVLTKDLPLGKEVEALVFEGREPYLGSIYLGLSALPLVVAGILAAERKALRWLVALALLALVVAMGRYTIVYDALLRVLPPLAVLRYPVKATLLVAFVWSLLAAHGIEALRRAEEGRGRRVAGLTALLGALLAALVGAALLLGGGAIGPRLLRPGVPEPAALFHPEGVRVLGAGGAAALLGTLLLAGPSLRNRAGIARVVACVLADLFFAHRGLNPTLPRDQLERAPETLGAMAGTDLPRLYTFEYWTRVLGKQYRRGSDEAAFAVPPEYGLPHRAAVALAMQAYLPAWVGSRWGIQGSFIPDQLNLLSRPARSLNALLAASEETPAFARLLQVAGVTHVFALHDVGLEGLVPIGRFPGHFVRAISAYQVPGALPRTYAVDRLRVLDGAPAYWALVDPGFEPTREIIVPSGLARAGEASFQGRCELRRYLMDRVVIESELSHDGYVVLLDAYDRGWRAEVDGEDAPVLRANTAFRAVPVPAGRHRVELVYRPSSVRVGAAVSAGTIALLVLGLAVSRSRRTR